MNPQKSISQLKSLWSETIEDAPFEWWEINLANNIRHYIRIKRKTVTWLILKLRHPYVFILSSSVKKQWPWCSESKFHHIFGCNEVGGGVITEKPVDCLDTDTSVTNWLKTFCVIWVRFISMFPEFVLGNSQPKQPYREFLKPYLIIHATQQMVYQTFIIMEMIINLFMIIEQTWGCTSRFRFSKVIMILFKISTSRTFSHHCSCP